MKKTQTLTFAPHEVTYIQSLYNGGAFKENKKIRKCSFKFKHGTVVVSGESSDVNYFIDTIASRISTLEIHDTWELFDILGSTTAQRDVSQVITAEGHTLPFLVAYPKKYLILFCSCQPKDLIANVLERLQKSLVELFNVRLYINIERQTLLADTDFAIQKIKDLVRPPVNVEILYESCDRLTLKGFPNAINQLKRELQSQAFPDITIVFPNDKDTRLGFENSVKDPVHEIIKGSANKIPVSYYIFQFLKEKYGNDPGVVLFRHDSNYYAGILDSGERTRTVSYIEAVGQVELSLEHVQKEYLMADKRGQAAVQILVAKYQPIHVKIDAISMKKVSCVIVAETLIIASTVKSEIQELFMNYTMTSYMSSARDELLTRIQEKYSSPVLRIEIQNRGNRIKRMNILGPTQDVVKVKTDIFEQVSLMDSEDLQNDRALRNYGYVGAYENHLEDIYEQPVLCEVEDQILRQDIIALFNQLWEKDRGLMGFGRDAVDIKQSVFAINSIARVENPFLYREYMGNRARMQALADEKQIPRCFPTLKSKGYDDPKTSGPLFALNEALCETVNEAYLFHGTKQHHVNSICKQGLDYRCSGNGLFGQGMYFSDSPVKADQYTDPKSSRQNTGLKIVLARVLLGDIYPCTEKHAFTRPPCKTCKTGNLSCTNHAPDNFFDSVLGLRWSSTGQNLNFREFIVYEVNQIFPEFIITYDRKI